MSNLFGNAAGLAHPPVSVTLINHMVSYAEDENHTQGVENSFSLLMRGIYETFHRFPRKHLRRYSNEFSHRLNRRGEQKRMFDQTMKGFARGKALPYKAHC